jgi:hypothetical protein
MIVIYARRDAVDALRRHVLFACGRTALKRTAKSCGPDAPLLAFKLVRSKLPRVTVTTKPGRRGEHEISRKAIAQGMPVETGEPVARPGHFLPKPRVHRTPGIPRALLEGRARPRLRGSQAPSLSGGGHWKTSGTACRENADLYPSGRRIELPSSPPYLA